MTEPDMNGTERDARSRVALIGYFIVSLAAFGLVLPFEIDPGPVLITLAIVELVILEVYLAVFNPPEIVGTVIRAVTGRRRRKNRNEP